MGGRALKEGLTRRQNLGEYSIKVEEIIRVTIDSDIWAISDTNYCSDKTTFGDADIIYATMDDKPLDVDAVKSLFPETKDIVRNNTVISFEYKEMQVDLIHVINFDFAMTYFGYNDLGNFVGKIAHKFGLKFGHEGLYLPLRNGTQMLGEVLVTGDPKEALKFLDLDPRRLCVGFNNREEVFDYVASSKYYNPEFYLLENNNTIAKTRDAKRPSYHAFLEYGASKTGEFWQPNPDKTAYLPMIFENFSTVKFNYENLLAEHAYQNALKEKFNGNLVGQLTLLWGNELGEFMQHLRKQQYFQGYNLYLQDHNSIANEIRMEYKRYVDAK